MMSLIVQLIRKLTPEFFMFDSGGEISIHGLGCIIINVVTRLVILSLFPFLFYPFILPPHQHMHHLSQFVALDLAAEGNVFQDEDIEHFTYQEQTDRSGACWSFADIVER
jgi:hypothetical protein